MLAPKQGFKVYLLEKSGQLGGIAKDIHRTIEGENVREYIEELIRKTRDHDLIQVLTRSIIVDHFGMPGLFTTGIQVAPGMHYRQIKHGVTILAIGALPNRPKEYLLDEHNAVLTQLELDRILDEQEDKVKSWQNVAMIHCVGSRTEENPNCSRICCQSAIKNALHIKEMNPDGDIYVLYRDIRMYGFLEEYYTEARRAGIFFFRYDPEEMPVVESTGCHRVLSDSRSGDLNLTSFDIMQFPKMAEASPLTSKLKRAKLPPPPVSE